MTDDGANFLLIVANSVRRKCRFQQQSAKKKKRDEKLKFTFHVLFHIHASARLTRGSHRYRSHHMLMNSNASLNGVFYLICIFMALVSFQLKFKFFSLTQQDDFIFRSKLSFAVVPEWNFTGRRLLSKRNWHYNSVEILSLSSSSHNERLSESVCKLRHNDAEEDLELMISWECSDDDEANFSSISISFHFNSHPWEASFTLV